MDQEGVMKRVCIMRKEKARLMTLDAADETEFRATAEGSAPNATRLRGNKRYEEISPIIC